LKVYVPIILNFFIAIYMGGFLTHSWEIIIVSFLFPLINILLVLLGTRNMLWAPTLVFLSGAAFTVSYSLSFYNEFIIYNHFMDIFYDFAFPSAFLTFVITFIINTYSIKDEK
jgi:hypothetical protein